VNIFTIQFDCNFLVVVQKDKAKARQHVTLVVVLAHVTQVII